MTETMRGLVDTVAGLRDGVQQVQGIQQLPRVQPPPEHHLPVGRRENAAGPVNHYRHIKLDCPRFDGGDPTEWMSKLKQYFSFHEVPFEQRQTRGGKRLLRHYDWIRIPLTGKHLSMPSEGENFHEALSKIQQTGSLRDYQREFERLTNKVDNWSEEALVGTFLGGLRDNIADHVHMFSPTTMRAVIKLARLRDEQIQKQRRSFTPRPPLQSNTTRPPLQSNTNPSPVTAATPKRLRWDEMKRKRSLGLCFRCDERYTPGHKCKTSQLLLMLGTDAEDEEDEEIFHDTTEPEITLQSLTGWDSPKTMRVAATINRQRLVALIDSGATHNFISDREANRLNLKLTPMTPFSVRVADGHPLRCRGSYRHTAMLLGDASFTVDFYALQLSGLDVVLGVQWLESLGPILCNWKAHSLEFMWAERLVKLQGLHQQKITKAHYAEITKDAKLGQACFALTIQEERPGNPAIDTEMGALLERYNDVFQPLSALSPHREIEHHITLKEGFDPVNVRPYRYAHFQKDEI
ncbi:unnamed protein product [Arabidopsis thaliana]|uniref:Retrotransposon gag domain-containing protein n=1 Tax=Arabidopsis thaliana TaxID=3702 RepID=A0A5S9WIR0_ARATH|nr:unnamed protein product [Arabidopsis thaliana]